MADFFGTGIEVPSIEFGSLFSDTWVFVAIIGLVGVALVVGIGVLLFFNLYNKKIILFENISGLGYQPIIRTRARRVKVGNGSAEILKTLSGGMFLSADGKKMGRNTFWFAKGPDGYWYNFVLADLDTKLKTLDIDPVDRDLRMLHLALDRLTDQTYGKTGFIEKYGVHLILFLFLITLIGGMWVIVGKVGQATEPLAANQQMSMELTKAQGDLSTKLSTVVRSIEKLLEVKIVEVNTNSSGLVAG